MKDILKEIMKNEPKIKTISTKITEKEYQILEDFCKKNNCKKSTLVNYEILQLIRKITEDNYKTLSR